MASTRIEDLSHDTQERVQMLIDLAAKEGLGIHPISTKRSCAEQHGIYAEGRTAPGTIRTQADGCRSWHVWGRAIDLLIVRDGKIVGNSNDKVYDRLGELAESIGMKWGGNFPGWRDAIHFEYHPGVKSSEVCPDPSKCEWSIKQDWPGPDVPPDQKPPPSPTDGTKDVSYTDDEGKSQGTPFWLMAVAGVAAVGSGYVAMKAYRSYERSRR